MLEVSARLMAPIGQSGTQLPQPMHASWSMWRWGFVIADRSSGDAHDRPSAAAPAALPLMNWRRSIVTLGIPEPRVVTRSMTVRIVSEKTEPCEAFSSRRARGSDEIDGIYA